MVHIRNVLSERTYIIIYIVPYAINIKCSKVKSLFIFQLLCTRNHPKISILRNALCRWLQNIINKFAIVKQQHYIFGENIRSTTLNTMVFPMCVYYAMAAAWLVFMDSRVMSTCGLLYTISFI